MRDPEVTVVTPSFNSSAYIDEAIRSVRQQSCSDWEHIVVDDGSTDDTRVKLDRAAEQDDRLKVVLLRRNRGAAYARNTAIEMASGRYIAFLDSDDLWEPDKLEVQLELFRRSGAPLVYGAYYWMEESGERPRVVRVPEKIDYRGLLNATVIATVTAMYDTKVVGKIMMPSLRKRQDYALWLRVLRLGGQAVGAQKPLATLRKRKGSLSSNKASALLYTWRVYRECEGLSLGRSAYHFASYATRAFIKSIG